jgi:plasmid stability protein
MGQILVRNLDDAVIERLKLKAKRENSSLEQTVRDIITAAAKPSRQEVIDEIRRIRAMMPASTLDSAALIREDRDNDEPYR